MAMRFGTVAFVLLAFGLSYQVDGDEAAPPQLPPNVNELLRWLPVDTETLFVANGPFQIPCKADDSFKFLESLQSIPVASVAHVCHSVFQRELRGRNILIAVEGSRCFRSPKDIGEMPYQGCQVLRFDDSSDYALKTAFQLCLDKADKRIRLGDIDVAVFREKLEADDWSFFLAHPKPSVLLCATDQSFLEQVLKRIKQENKDRALPEDLLEWREVNFRASVWAIRHYRKETARQDPSSPLRDKAADNVPDGNAKGFVFWYDARSGNVAKARYLSSAKDAVRIVTVGWNYPSEKLMPTITESRPGVVEISASIVDDRVGRSFIFILVGYLGHGVWV